MCGEGNNRSVHIAHLLRYKGHDTLSAGVRTAEPETLKMLADWADRVIVTEQVQRESFPGHPAVDLWAIPDDMPRPFNSLQNQMVRAYIERSGL